VAEAGAEDRRGREPQDEDTLTESPKIDLDGGGGFDFNCTSVCTCSRCIGVSDAGGIRCGARASRSSRTDASVRPSLAVPMAMPLALALGGVEEKSCLFTGKGENCSTRTAWIEIVGSVGNGSISVDSVQ
jgi:hypothetical protein